MDAVAELHIPDRDLYLLDGDGAADHSARRGAVDSRGGPSGRPRTARWTSTSTRPEGQEVRLHAERFTGGAGATYVAVAVADRLELEDRYASLIEVFAAAALVALLLVAGGGYVLVRQSTAPVERSMEQMRRFMADAAHELRTPVTLLRTRADVALGQERAAERDAETLRAVGREAERIGVDRGRPAHAGPRRRRGAAGRAGGRLPRRSGGRRRRIDPRAGAAGRRRPGGGRVRGGAHHRRPRAGAAAAPDPARERRQVHARGRSRATRRHASGTGNARW